MIDENPKLDDLLTDIVKNQARVDSDIRFSNRGALLQARSWCDAALRSSFDERCGAEMVGRRRLGGARGAGSGNIRDLIESTYGHLLDVRHRSSAVEYRETEVVQLPTARRAESA